MVETINREVTAKRGWCPTYRTLPMAQVTWIVTSRCTAGCPTPSQVLGFAFFLFFFGCSRTSKRTDRKTFKSIMGRRRGSEVEGWPSSCRERASSLQRLGYSFLVKKKTKKKQNKTKQKAPRFPNIPIINMQTTNRFVNK